MAKHHSIMSSGQGLKTKRFFDRALLVGERYTTAVSPLLEALEKRMLMAAPSGLAAFGTSESSITVRWTDNATDETHFIVDRSVDGVNFKRVGSVPANSTSFPDTGLQANTTYYYRVKAITTTVNSGWARVSGSTLVTGTSTLPGAPSGVGTTSPSGSLMRVSWSDNADNETHFLLERSTDSINYRRIASLGANTTSFLDSGLTAGAAYQYRIRSVNGIGGSKWVRGSGVTITPPAMPSSFAAATTSQTAIQLTWTDASNNETNFVIDRSIDGVTYQRVATISANIISYLDEGLEAGRTYLYSLKSINAAGSSKWARAIGATQGAPVTIIEDFSAGTGGFAVVDGAWSLVNGEYGITAENNAATTHLNSRVVHDTVLEGDFNLTVDAQAVDSGIPWNNVAVIFGYQDELNYYFFSSNQSNDGGTNGLFRVVNGVSTELADIASTITPGVVYQLRVERQGSEIRAYQDNVLVASADDQTFLSGKIGLGSRQFQASFDNLLVNGTAQSPPTVPPAAPSDLTAQPTSSSTIALAWTDNASDESSSTIERSEDGSLWTTIATVGRNVQSFTAQGLSAATEYFFRVLSSNAAGNSAYSNTANATTQAADALVKPDATNTGPNDMASLFSLPVRAPAPGGNITAPGTYSGFNYTGNITITADNVILENFVLRGTIDISGYVKNITIRNFKMSGNCAIGSYARIPDVPGAKNVIIEHGEITDAPGGAVIWGFGLNSGLIVRYLYIHDTAGDVFRPWFGGFTLEHNYVKDIGLGAGDVHADVLQAWNLDGVVMRYNNFDAGPHGSGVLTMYDNNRNILIEDNWFNGAGYAFSVDSKAGANNIVRHNRWGRGSNFGPVYPTPQTYEIWDDNTYEDNGQVINHV